MKVELDDLSFFMHLRRLLADQSPPSDTSKQTVDKLSELLEAEIAQTATKIAKK